MKISLKSFFIILILLIATLAIPLTILQVKKQQETRSRASGAPITIELSPARQTVAPGTDVDVQVLLNAGGYQISSANLKLAFDVANISITNFAPEPNLSTVLTNIVDNAVGTLRFEAVKIFDPSSQPLTGNRILLGTIKAHAKEIGNGTIRFTTTLFTASNQLDFLPVGMSTNATITIIQPGTTPSVTPNQTPTTPPATPPIQTPTATLITPTATQSTPTPSTTPAPSISVTPSTGNLSFTITLPGIEKNRTGISPKQLDVEILNPQGQAVLAKTATLIYNPANAEFLGAIDTEILQGDYLVRIRTSHYLRRLVKTIITLTPSTSTQLPSIALIPGDIKEDNIVNTEDWSVLVGCYSDLTPAKSCTEQQKPAADLNEDGKVDAIDINLFLKQFTLREGD